MAIYSLVTATRASCDTLSVARVIQVWLLLSVAAGPTWAVDSGRTISQYGHSAWRVQDGLFIGSPNAITQTADGYMWIATENGLVRFDGVHFTPWSSPDGSKLPSSNIRNLLSARDGTLWVATAAGLSRWHNGVLANFVHDPSTFEPLVESRDGTIWTTREESIGSGVATVCQVTAAGMQCSSNSDAIASGIPLAMAEDTSGNLWLGTQGALIRWRPGSPQVYAPPALASHAGIGISTIASDPDGELWVGMALRGRGLGLQKFNEGVWKPFIVPGFDSSALLVQTVLVDRHRAVWIGTYDDGIYRIVGKRVEHFGSRDGLSGDNVRRFAEDREGNLWVTTLRGIDCFHDVRMASFSKRDGITVTELDAVAAAHNGAVWIGGAEGLNSLRSDSVSAIHPPTGVPGNQYTALLEDHAGQLWTGIDNSLWTYADGRFHRITRQNGTDTGMIADLAEDVDHDIWAESVGPPRSLLRVRGLKVVEEIPTSLVPGAHTIAADPESGIWLGLLDGDMARFRHGNLERFKFEHKLPSHVVQIAAAPDGSVLGATPMGLIGWRAGVQGTLTQKNGLPCDAIFAFIWDRHDALWLYAQCGLIQIPAASMQSWWKDPNTQVSMRVFDAFDGVQPEGAPFRSAARSSDGRLWFVNLSLLQMIDPEQLAGNLLPPPVYIEAIVADRHSYPAQDGLHLPALSRNLEIDYTALSFMAPQKMHFRYKLEGRDSEWQESGSRRQAFYTDLRPGSYRFRVTASNNDDVWNTAGATLKFNVAPAWYQTYWFWLACLLALAIAATAAYRWRMRQVFKSYTARFDERLAERTRLARELHDTLLQTVQGSKMVADAALHSRKDSDHVRNEFERVSAWLGQAIEEARAALNSLRTSTTETNDLASSLRRATQDCRIHAQMEVVFSVVGNAKDIHPIVRDEIYRIGYEAIRNACTHSMGGRVEVTLEYAQDLVLRVTDNGVGIDPQVLDAGKSGHFGLQGMRERAARIGGHMTIRSSAASGTEVCLVVPGKFI